MELNIQKHEFYARRTMTFWWKLQRQREEKSIMLTDSAQTVIALMFSELVITDIVGNTLFVLFWLKTKKWSGPVRRSLSFFSLLRTYSNFLWNAFLCDQSNFLETKLCFITLGRSCYMCFRRLKQRTRKKKHFKQLLFVYYW